MSGGPITKSQFARHIGVVPGRITQLIDRGLPVRHDDLIDLAEALAWCRLHIDPAGRRAHLGPSFQPLPGETPDETARRFVEGQNLHSKDPLL